MSSLGGRVGPCQICPARGDELLIVLQTHSLRERKEGGRRREKGREREKEEQRRGKEENSQGRYVT